MISIPSSASSASSLGQCWAWDYFLVLSSALSNILIFFGFASLSILCLYIYRRAGLRSLVLSYPQIWRVGIISLFSCAISRLGQVAEIWYGGSLFYLIAALNTFTGLSALTFVYLLWQVKEEMIMMSQIVSRTLAEQDQNKVNSL